MVLLTLTLPALLTLLAVIVSEATVSEIAPRNDSPMSQVIEAAKQAREQFSPEEMTAMTFVMVAELYTTVEDVKPAITKVSDDLKSGGLAGMMGAMLGRR